MQPNVDDSIEIININNNEEEDEPLKKSNGEPDSRNESAQQAHEPYQSDEKKNIKDVRILRRVLRCRNKVADKLFTLEVPLLCDELDIISVILPNQRIIKDNTGYKIADINTENRIEVNQQRDADGILKYVVNIQSETPRQDMVVPIEDDESQVIDKDEVSSPLRNPLTSSKCKGSMDSHAMPPLCDESEIIRTIIPVNRIIKEKWGYKVIDGNTEKRVTIMALSKAVKARRLSTCTTCQLYRMNVKSARILRDNLLISKQFSDVTLCVDGRDINAHKKILANASPVFKAMMLTNLRSNKVVINDISYDTTCHILNFIYTGKIPDVYSNDAYTEYTNLLKADVEYGVVGLQIKCMEEILRFLTITNVIEFMKMADASNCLYLRQLVIDFIVDNAQEIVDLPSYQSYLSSHPQISTEIIRGLFAKQSCAK